MCPASIGYPCATRTGRRCRAQRRMNVDASETLAVSAFFATNGKFSFPESVSCSLVILWGGRFGSHRPSMMLETSLEILVILGTGIDLMKVTDTAGMAITSAGAMASSVVLSLSEAGISSQAGAPAADLLDKKFAPTAEDGLLVIDVQCDFMPGGALPVPGGTEVIGVVNALVPRFEHVVLSQDWHPDGHSSFASQHEGKNPYDETTFPYGQQTLWPDHCRQNTAGSSFHADLTIPQTAVVCRKGFRPEIDSYSAFFENDSVTATGLEHYLQQLGVKRVFVVGLAYDFCVRYTCEDAANRCGLDVILVRDATRAVGLPGSVEAAVGGLKDAGVRVCTAGELGTLS